MVTPELRKQRREKGLCTFCGGKRDDDKFLMCSKCRDAISSKRRKHDYLCGGRKVNKEQAEKYSKKRKEKAKERVEKGLCRECGNPIDDKSYKTCTNCRLKQRKYRKEMKELKESLGRCNVCGIVPVFDGEKRCPECRNKLKNIKHKYLSDIDVEEYRKKQVSRQNDLRKKYRSIGLCSCGRKLQDGYKTCNICRIKERERRQKRMIKNGRMSFEERKEKTTKGICWLCNEKVKQGLNNKFENYKVCEKHYKMLCDSSSMVNRSDNANHPWRKDNKIIFNKKQ